jgi:site-specific recombinase XerD
LAARTVSYRLAVARLFLSECDGRELQSVSIAEVSSFVVRQCSRLNAKTVKGMATALRSFLGYLYVEGLTDHQLAQAVPAPSWPHGAGLPRWMSWPEVTALLADRDEGSLLGLRDHAIVVLLVRLGLRAGEVAGLRLDDIDWHAGEFIVRGKQARTERLPLPVDVGEALVAYLQHGRPQTSCRALFLQINAPLGLSAGGVARVVRRACTRAGIRLVGPQRLRHSAATAMLRAGASLDEVGQVLRQRNGRVTAHYAKVDFVALRKLAAPWPGDAA